MKLTRFSGLLFLGLALVWLPSAQTVHPPSGGASLEANSGPERDSVSDSIIVIRYDPAAIFLTHNLVAPLCRKEVKIAGKDGVSLGWMEFVPMADNELQPKGVFVGQARVHWSAGGATDADQRDALFESGLDQLRRALSARLVEGRARGLHQRLSALQQMADERQAELADSTQQLAVRDRQRLLGEDGQRLRAMLQELEIETRASRENLMVRMSRIAQSETALVQAQAVRETIERDSARAKKLYESGHVSQSELAKTDLALQAAAGELAKAEADLAAGRHELASMESRIKDRENTMADIQARLKQVHEEASALGAGASDPLLIAKRHMNLDIQRELQREQLGELQVEVQRLTAQMHTLRDVQIERW